MNSWYHVSPSENRESILNLGIQPTHKKRYGGIPKEKVYLWKHKELALYYALTESRDWEIPFDIFEIKQNLSVEDDDTLPEMEAYMTDDEVLPENIILIDTVKPKDSRIKKYGDIDTVFEMIDDLYEEKTMRGRIKDILQESLHDSRKRWARYKEEKKRQNEDSYKDDPDHCPSCGSGDIKSDPMEKARIEDKHAVLNRRCLNCGERWEHAWEYGKIADPKAKIHALRK